MLTLLVSFYSTPGFTNERMTIFLAESLRRVADPPDSDVGEPISLSVVPIAEAIALIEDGRITDGKTIVGILRAFHHLERQRQEYSG